MDRAYKELDSEYHSLEPTYLVTILKALLLSFQESKLKIALKQMQIPFHALFIVLKWKWMRKKNESVPISIPRADNVGKIRGRFVFSKIPKCEERFIQQNLFVRLLFKSQWYFRMVRSFLVESKSKHISHVHLMLAEPTLVCPQLWSCMKYLCCQSNWSISMNWTIHILKQGPS